MKFGILGAGNVGGALGQRLMASGHEVRFGVRSPEGREHCVDAAEAVRFGEIVINALPWRAAEGLLPTLGLDGRVLIDCSNPVGWNNGPQVIARGLETLKGSTGAKVAKAWSTFGAEHIHDRGIDVFIAGDDEAKDVLKPLIAEMGQNAVDCGGVAQAYRLEELAALWIHLATGGGKGRGWTFKTQDATG